MSKLTRDGTAEPVSRDQILWTKQGQGNNHFPFQPTTSRIGNLRRLILDLATCDNHTYNIYSSIHIGREKMSKTSEVPVGGKSCTGERLDYYRVLP